MREFGVSILVWRKIFASCQNFDVLLTNLIKPIAAILIYHRGNIMFYLRLALILMLVVVTPWQPVIVGNVHSYANTNILTNRYDLSLTVLTPTAAIISSAGQDPNQPRQQTKASNVPQAKLTRQGLLREFQTLYITSETQFFEAEVLQKELYQNKLWNQWNLTVVDDPLAADMVITVDRPALTFDYVFKVVDQKNQIVVCAGKKVAFDGVRAARGIAEQLIKCIKESNRATENQSDKTDKLK
jgi:hypothetical protein